MKYNILVINPGSSSTKLAWYENERPAFEKSLRHPKEKISKFPKVIDQYDYRKGCILEKLKESRFNIKSLSCVVGRGGPFKPLLSGTYEINKQLIEDIKAGNIQSEHSSLLGALLASAIAKPLNIPAFFVDPVSVDEFWGPSRFSGLPEIERKSLSHALNVRMVAKEAAKRLKKTSQKCNFVIVHLGTGITVASHLKGIQVDASNANEDGPFSPQRAGNLPTAPLVELCYSRKYKKDEILEKLQRSGGLIAYLGTDDISEIEQRINSGDMKAKRVYDAMIYQIAKEIGAYSVVLKGTFDAIIITGGIAHSKHFIQKLKTWIKFLSNRIFVYPGEGEMLALAKGALRVLKGEEKVREYR